MRSVIISLVDLGVIASPPPDAELTEVAAGASVAAQAWLEAHPAQG